MCGSCGISLPRGDDTDLDRIQIYVANLDGQLYGFCTFLDRLRWVQENYAADDVGVRILFLKDPNEDDSYEIDWSAGNVNEGDIVLDNLLCLRGAA